MDLDTGLERLGFLIAALMATYTLVSYFIQRRINQRARVAALHAEFYTLQNYRIIASPVYRIIVRLRGLPPEPRKQYLRIVLEGWCYNATMDSDVANYLGQIADEDDLRHIHFRDERDTEAFTEHEALTAFLYFWVRADRLLEQRLLDKRLFAELFRSGFAFYHDFLEELRTEICKLNPPEKEPSWVGATRRIEALLEKRTSAV